MKPGYNKRTTETFIFLLLLAMNNSLPRSPQRPPHASHRDATLRMFFCPRHEPVPLAFAAVLTPPGVSTAKQDDLTTAIKATYSNKAAFIDRSVQLGDTFDGMVFGGGGTRAPIKISRPTPVEPRLMPITVLATRHLPMERRVATIWLYVAWGDIGRSPDTRLEHAFIRYFHCQYDRQRAEDSPPKRRKLDLDPISE